MRRYLRQNWFFLLLPSLLLAALVAYYLVTKDDAGFNFSYTVF